MRLISCLRFWKLNKNGIIAGADWKVINADFPISLFMFYLIKATGESGMSVKDAGRSTAGTHRLADVLFSCGHR